MTRKEQQDLAADLAENFTQAYLAAAAHAPKDWTGVELRRLMVDVAKERFAVDMNRARVREYDKARATIEGL